jgi:hypothetical protein
MNHADALNRVIEHMLTRATETKDPPADAVAHIASCRQCIAELAEFCSALTGKPSTLVQNTARLLTCQECHDALSAYVDDEGAGRNLAALHPDVARHLSACAACREYHDDLLRLFRQDEAGIFGEAPRSETWEEWLDRHPWPSIWERMEDGLLRLKVDLPAQVAEASARAAESLVHLFRPHGLALAFRDRGPEGKGIELLELPCPEADLVIHVLVGPPLDGKCTLSLQISALETTEPIPGVRVRLFEGSDKLRRNTATDLKGQVDFEIPRSGRFTLRVDHAGHSLQFSLPLEVSPDR